MLWKGAALAAPYVEKDLSGFGHRGTLVQGMGESMTNSLIWEACGEVNIVDGRPVSPKVVSAPGLYRLKFRNGWWYIGESANIQRRLSDYSWPGQGIEPDHRIYHALIDAGGATLEIFTQGDLSTKSNRCVIEFREIATARAEGKNLLNGGSKSNSFLLEMSIKYHESEIERLRHKLNALSPEKE